ncbi:MAG TPA: spore coat protein, partial [Bacteroidetes bacterium]|nr:spore coat protein [Bacteroidota bacterium]
IEQILIVTGGNNAGEFLRLLGNGRQFGLRHINYTYQEGEGGIADALKLAEYFADQDKIVVILGDNILEKDITDDVKSFAAQREGAKILLREVSDPGRFGVAEVQGDKVVNIVEKPLVPKTNLAVVGVYMYDHKVFDFVKKLVPSDRGELEITDVNNAYIKKGQMTYNILSGWWTDAGTFESLFRANKLIAEKKLKS